MTISAQHNVTSRRQVARAFVGSARNTVELIFSRRLIQPRELVGARLRFQDGSDFVVFRETAVVASPNRAPATLVVQFTLRLIGRNRLAHVIFRRECLLRTPLFAGFAGFRSKLWLADRATGSYRGVYEWDGADRAERYAITLSRLLEVLSVPGSVRHQVLPGLPRDRFLHGFEDPLAGSDTGDAWSRLCEPVRSSRDA